jgi:hypothetical protein
MQALNGVTGLPPIPAMTSDAERECYYRLAQECAQLGCVVELGAWLGASTAYIAAGYRDGGGQGKVQVYDKFLSKPGHLAKVNAFYAKQGIEGAMPIGDAMARFTANLGPLATLVEAHRCQIENVHWGSAPIALMVTDAPKRVPAISRVLTNFRGGLVTGTIMAWQDFCHFPSYEIPACLYRLADRMEFVEAVVPGTTLVFRITSQWEPGDVGLDRLGLTKWTPTEIAAAWDYWLDGKVPAEKADLFRCGQAMFLCDTGFVGAAVEVLSDVMAHEPADVIAKWQYLATVRPDFVDRYAPLFGLLRGKKVLEPC